MSSTKRILILLANPKDTARLRLDEEVREIEEGLTRSKNRNQFIIQSKWAVRLKDLRRAILDYEPSIVHFCGHGEENGLNVEDEHGNTVLVPPEVLAGLFKLFTRHIECVLLNACYSQIQAEAINEHINYVIGMSQGITDENAIEFAIGFYDALGAGKNFEEAFEFGCNAIQLYNIPEHLRPVLNKKAASLGDLRETGEDFGLTGNGNADTFRLRQQINELMQQWNLLSQKISDLEHDRIFETRREEKMRLKRLIDEMKHDRQQIAQQLDHLEQKH